MNYVYSIISCLSILLFSATLHTTQIRYVLFDLDDVLVEERTFFTFRRRYTSQLGAWLFTCMKQYANEKQHNTKFIIFSNADSNHIDNLRNTQSDMNALLNQFDAIYPLRDHKLQKPNTEAFQFILDTYNTSAKQCLLIDDNPRNVAGALSLKMHAIQFNKHNISHITKQTQKLGLMST